MRQFEMHPYDSQLLIFYHKTICHCSFSTQIFEHHIKPIKMKILLYFFMLFLPLSRSIFYDF